MLRIRRPHVDIPRAFLRRRDRLKRIGAITAGAAASALAATALAPAALADTADDVSTSGNVEHIANLAKEGPFADSSSFNSDLAFTGDYAVDGNYSGFTVYDISDPRSPQAVSQVLCEGGQGDVSISGDLLYYSVDYPRESDECGAPASTPADADAFEGLRIFDISDKAEPAYVGAVRTDCGSHTNTLVPGGDGTDYVYVSSYAPSDAYPNCQTPHDKISVVEVPTDAPSSAEVVNEPVLFPTAATPAAPGSCVPPKAATTSPCFPAGTWPRAPAWATA